MSTKIFRQEVYDARRNAWLGSIRIPAPRLGWVFSLFSLFTLAAVVIVLSLGTYTRRERVSGTIIPSRGLFTAVSPFSGVVKKSFAANGATVRKGEPLIEISEDLHSSALVDIHAAIILQLKQKRTTLQSDLEQNDRLAVLKRNDMHDQIKGLEMQLEEIDRQIKYQTQRTSNTRKLLEKWSETDADSAVSMLQAFHIQDAALFAESQLADLDRQKISIRQQLRQLQAQYNQIPAITIIKRNETLRLLADVAQLLQENETLSSVSLRAQDDGVVVSVMARPGQSVLKQQPLVTVLSQPVIMQAELWVPSRVIGFITPGDVVVLRYISDPFQKYGQHQGRVREVSHSSVPPGDLSRFRGKTGKVPLYRVLVDLDKQTIQTNGRQIMLLPDMPVEADISLERQRLIEWVSEPMLNFAKGQAGRSQADLSN